MYIALTGVTGKLGKEVARVLSEAGVPARHLARSPERAEKFPFTEVVQASYENSPQAQEALKGIDILFMVSAKEHPQRLEQHLAFIDAAKLAGVRHIVYTSFYNAREDSTFTLARDHARTEKYIQEQGFTYTFLRDNFYLDFFVELCQTYGELRGPAGNGAVSAVARTDVAAVVSQIMKAPSKWENQTLNMTGSENLTLQEMVDRVGKVLGRKIQYVEETLEEAYESRKSWPAEQWEYDSWVSTYTAIATGEQEGLSPDIEHVLGITPTSLEECVKQHQ